MCPAEASCCVGGDSSVSVKVACFMQGFYTTALLAAVHGQALEDVHAVQHNHEHALVHSKAARPMNMGRQKDGGVLCAKQVPFGLAV